MSPSETFPRDRFAGLLGAAAVAGAFRARRTARPDGLRLVVSGVGPIAMPVSVWQAKQLCQMGRPARFGRGEQTLVDAKVRDTWEVPKSRVKIDRRQWNVTVRPILDRLRVDLGLPDGCRRPFTLVLSKTDALFAREREARRRDQTDLAWLARTFLASPAN